MPWSVKVNSLQQSPIFLCPTVGFHERCLFGGEEQDGLGRNQRSGPPSSSVHTVHGRVHDPVRIYCSHWRDRGKAQVVMLVTASRSKSRGGFPFWPPTAHLLCWLAPDGPQTGTNQWPRVWGFLSYQKPGTAGDDFIPKSWNSWLSQFLLEDYQCVSPLLTFLLLNH